MSLKYYSFAYDNQYFVIGINADREKVEKELEAYRADDPEYNFDGWEQRLRDKGYKIHPVVAEEILF